MPLVMHFHVVHCYLIELTLIPTTQPLFTTHMRLDQALVQRKLSESRTEAQELISLGYVLVDGAVCIKQTKQVADSSEIQITKRRKFVSRGGDKLEGALLHVYGSSDNIMRHLNDKDAVDVGASTGGFTDCLLSYGVRTSTTVDVGTSQLHTSLRDNPKVKMYENIDIRDYMRDASFDIVVADLSFISLEHVFEKIISLGVHESEFFLLIKPQFEVGKGNTKKGIVKDEELVTAIISKYSTLAMSYGLRDIAVFPCVITERDGNKEYFLHAKK